MSLNTNTSNTHQSLESVTTAQGEAQMMLVSPKGKEGTQRETGRGLRQYREGWNEERERNKKNLVINDAISSCSAIAARNIISINMSSSANT